jgi:hypothetical protein
LTISKSGQTLTDISHRRLKLHPSLGDITPTTRL